MDHKVHICGLEWYIQQPSCDLYLKAEIMLKCVLITAILIIFKIFLFICFSVLLLF